MLKILGGLFAARQRGVEDGAPALIKRPCRSELDTRSFDLDLVFDLRAPSSRLSRRRGTDWGMLSIIGGLLLRDSAASKTGRRFLQVFAGMH